MSSPEKVREVGLKREEGWLYYVDKKGNIARSRLLRGSMVHDRSGAEVMVKTEIPRESGWLYFIDKDGDVARVQMVGSKGHESTETKMSSASARSSKTKSKSSPSKKDAKKKPKKKSRR